MIIDILFKKHIEYLDLDSIKQSPDVVYIVDEDLVLRAYNYAWIEFAKSNGGEMIISRYQTGVTITDAFVDPIKDYITSAYRMAMNENKPFEYDYECPSADQYRLFHQTAYPLVESKGLVISNHLVEECEHSENEHEFRKHFTVNGDYVYQCANCRKIKDPQNEQLWLWVPSLVEKPYKKVSHGLCPRCYDHYYPEIDI